MFEGSFKGSRGCLQLGMFQGCLICVWMFHGFCQAQQKLQHSWATASPTVNRVTHWKSHGVLENQYPMGYPRPPWKSRPTQISHGGIGIPMDPVNLCYLGFPYPHWNSNGSLMDIDFFIITWLGGGGRGILKQGPGLGGSCVWVFV